MTWIFRSYILTALSPAIDDTLIAVVAGILMFILPSREKGSKTLLTWEDTRLVPWGVLLLFGGGLAIAEAFQETGLASWLGHQLTNLKALPLITMILIIVGVVNFLTEITSNLATTAMILPVLAAFASVMGTHPFTLLVPATLAASCAFMLPVATPPNAVVFASGHLSINDMVKKGIGYECVIHSPNYNNWLLFTTGPLENLD